MKSVDRFLRIRLNDWAYSQTRFLIPDQVWFQLHDNIPHLVLSEARFWVWETMYDIIYDQTMDEVS